MKSAKAHVPDRQDIILWVRPIDLFKGNTSLSLHPSAQTA